MEHAGSGPDADFVGERACDFAEVAPTGSGPSAGGPRCGVLVPEPRGCVESYGRPRVSPGRTGSETVPTEAGTLAAIPYLRAARTVEIARVASGRQRTTALSITPASRGRPRRPEQHFEQIAHLSLLDEGMAQGKLRLDLVAVPPAVLLRTT